MTDLVERLRYCACVEENPTFEIAMKEAANEIERLSAGFLAATRHNDILQGDNERLRKDMAEAREYVSLVAGFAQPHTVDQQGQHPIFGVNGHYIFIEHARSAATFLERTAP